ncbi:MAG: aa3-type cytochrome oxidase subunit IV [Actinomycetota bacterium]
MRTATKVLVASAAFGGVIAVAYWLVAYEIAGTIFLAAMGASLLLAATFAARWARGEPPPQDRPGARPADAAGERVGPFPEASVWPVVLAAGSLLLAAGLIYGVWLVVLGGLIAATALMGMIREGR